MEGLRARRVSALKPGSGPCRYEIRSAARGLGDCLRTLALPLSDGGSLGGKSSMRQSLALLFALGSLLACRHIDPWTHEYNLENAQLAYPQSMRWGKFEQASQWIAPADRPRFFLEAEQLQDVRISEYD